jgi:3-oxoacyl-(acyl-carrier-protein) synthase
MSRRVVITGVGAVTPLGAGARALYERWCAGECGIEDGVGRCSHFDPTERLSKKEVRRTDRFSQFAIVACEEALEQAGWDGELGSGASSAPASAASRRSSGATTCSGSEDRTRCPRSPFRS